MNNTDGKYFWESFSKDSSELVDTFLKVFPFQSSELLTPSILFLDFFPFNFNKDDGYKFINEKFNVKFEQSFISRFQGDDLNVCNHLNFIGTTITSTSEIKFMQSNVLATDFYSGDYDITVKMPKTMILSQKVKIRSISTFKPKVIL